MLTKKKIIILDSLMREKSGYATYPAELEKKLGKKVSRAGAAVACKQLVDLGILKLTEKRSPTWSESTAHYGLREDTEAFINLTKNYFQTLAKSDPYSWQSNAIWTFMGSQYAKRQINSNLIRSIFSSKKVKIQLLIKVGKEIKNQEVVSEHFKHYIPFSFPVLPPNTTIEEISSKVTIHSDEMANEQKESIPRVIENHYRDTEEKTLILPILALLQISPSALMHFLDSWEPYERDDDCISFSSSSQGFDMIEHVLFRLVWNTINDLSLIRAVPDMGNVFMAEISGGKLGSGKSAPLLRVMCHDHLLFEYEAGFDTDHVIYGDEFVEVVTNPENCKVKINWNKKDESKSTSQ